MAALDKTPEVDLSSSPEQIINVDEDPTVGSSQEVASLDSCPVLPCCASNWNNNDAEKIAIFYENNSHYYILERLVNMFEKGQHFDQLIQSFETLMEEVFSTKKHEQERVLGILSRSTASTEEEKTFLRELEGRSGMKLVMLLHNDDFINDLVKKTGIRRDALKLHCIPNIVEYLTQFQLILREMREGRPPNETTFQSLFTSFAKIFAIQFRCGKIRQKRSMNIFGQEVKGEPDLRYGLYDLDLNNENRDGEFVVCVTEVKKSVPLCTETELPCRTTHSRSTEDLNTSSSAKRMKMDDGNKYFLTERVKGQHAAELLLELPYSVLKISGEKRHMLGLIVQATKIQLTCLEMTTEHLKLIKENKFQCLRGRDVEAHIYHSSPFDMFNKEDRKDLVYIMLALGSIGQPRNRKMLPIAHLEQFLQ